METALIIGLVQLLLKAAPEAIVHFREIFSKKEITALDWEMLKAKIEASKYSDYVKDSQLPKDP